jgi:hypothetical protein
MLSRAAKAYRSQFTALYAVATELSRRGYLVSITLGNAQAADLLCMAPGGKAFAVEVKGLSSPNAWLVGHPPSRADLYYVFVAVGSDREADGFYVLPSVEVARLLSEHISKYPNDTKASGFRFNALADFCGRWDLLPD